MGDGETMTNPEFTDRESTVDPAEPEAVASPLPLDVSRDPEVNDWDALEQARIVDLDDEDY
jgi:hypothetical protein